MESTKDIGKNVELNIYQESLDVLHSCATSEDDIDQIDITTRNIACNIAKKYIQRLVDKDIPQKPIFDETYVYSSGLCPKCNSHKIINHESYEKNVRCSDCGQTIDWSKNASNL